MPPDGKNVQSCFRIAGSAALDEMSVSDFSDMLMPRCMRSIRSLVDALLGTRRKPPRNRGTRSPKIDVERIANLGESARREHRQ